MEVHSELVTAALRAESQRRSSWRQLFARSRRVLWRARVLARSIW